MRARCSDHDRRVPLATKIEWDTPILGLTLHRRHPNVAAVALANKNARTVWALLAHDREFRPDYVPTPAAV